MKNSIFYIVVTILTLSCSDERNISSSDIYAIRNIGQLSTTEYTIGKIIKLVDSKSNWQEIEWKEWTEIPQYGERKILISCRANVKAGVDLGQIKDDDIKIDGKTIEVQLPPATVTSFSMNPISVRTEMENLTGSRSTFTQAEKTEFLKQGEEAIKTDMAQTRILQDANDNAKVFLEDFYMQMGFEKVIVKPTFLKQ